MIDNSDIDVGKLLADAKHGDAQAQFILAERFRKRAAVEIDAEQAFIWYRRAAVVGHAHAQYRLARCYSLGSGILADQEVALTWYYAARRMATRLRNTASAISMRAGPMLWLI